MKERYYSANSFFKDIFGTKVYRISLDAHFTCPNRDGTKGYGGCIYCNSGGSKALYVDSTLSLEEQLNAGINLFKRAKKATKFIAYFQPFSNTYAPLEKLKEIYSVALKHPDVAGISIGTRPDCIDDEKLNYLEEIAGEKFLMIEYGVQTLNNQSLKFVSRGHTSEEALEAIIKTKKRKNIFVLAHLIFILPYDTVSQMYETVKKLLSSGLDAFKFHHLYIEKDTPIEKLFYEGKIHLLERDEYIKILGEIISFLPPHISIHRLFGDCPKETLVAPAWTVEKTKNLNLLNHYLEENDIYQGKNSTTL